MNRMLVTAAAASLVLGISANVLASDWLHCLVRTSGLGWSDGYHAFDQCPPRHGHFPVRHPVTFPAWGASQGPHAPYYFEEPGYQAEAAKEAGELLPPAEPIGGDRTPGPQARYQPQSRYFQALQPQMQQAQRPQTRPPF